MNMMGENDICEVLEWDSQFFGLRIARFFGSRLSPNIVTDVERWGQINNIDCLYFLADATDARTCELAQENHFRFVDVRLTLEHRSELLDAPNEPPLPLRTASERDIPALRELARTAHRHSRFYFDVNFPTMRCDSLYEAWIEKSSRGWAQRVFVAGSGTEVDGYVTCHISGLGKGQIGLLGVREKARGKGLGKTLISSAVHWFRDEGVRTITVVTQGRNVAAQRLYQKCGFVTGAAEVWFHRWFTAEKAGQ
jgi:dTDP-4-amino-4,6-dideoxy-D-galactose acyltransferase